MVIHCDRCPIRMDLGPASIVSMRLRMPSGWVQDEPDHHMCPVCTRRELEEMVTAKQSAEGGPEPAA
jgi:hypothetical protein